MYASMKTAIIVVVIIFETVIRAPCVDCTRSSAFQVKVEANGSYSILVNNITWVIRGDTAFRGDGKTYSASDNTLKLIASSTGSGSDQFGYWSSTVITYQAGTYQVNATVKTYTDSYVQAAIFTQTYLGDAVNTSAESAQDVISKFPSFMVGHSVVDLGYLSYAGHMVGYSSMSIGRFNSTQHIATGIKGGPLVLFDSSSNVLVISPMSQFMAASNNIDSSQQINWGIMGFVNSVPRGYSVDFIVYYSNQGVNQAVRAWGNYMTTLYKKSTDRRDNDPTVRYLGYWTDNGSYYRNNPEKGKTYEATILDIVNYMKDLDVPFGYLQFDDWWYLKGAHEGTKTWEAQKNILPDGFRAIYDKTNLPFGCHNQFWDEETTYAWYNGGAYNFIRDNVSGLAVPDDSKFWQYLLGKTRSWGKFILYEQDWLNRETDYNTILLSDLFLGKRWLVEMGAAAENLGTVTIQYCTAYSRHVLQSLEIPVVTQARVSTDYHPGNGQWNIGISSLLADSLNIAPFKDTFWTTEVQPGNTYNLTEPNTRLQCLISTLSAGPVGPGDGIGFINKTLLMRCCDASGLILKPARPATAIDDQIKMYAFKPPYPGPVGAVYTTYTVFPGGAFFGIILAADLQNTYSLTPDRAWPAIQFVDSLAFPANDPEGVFEFSNSVPVQLGTECTARDFCLYYTSPLLKLESGAIFVILGELDKWVPMSQQRVQGIEQTGKDILVQITVQAKETVTFSIYVASKNKVETIVCDNSKSSAPALDTVVSVVDETCNVA